MVPHIDEESELALELDTEAIQAEKIKALTVLQEKVSRGMAHDVNNVLANIRGMTEIAQMQPDIPEMVRTALEKILIYVERGHNLTTQISDFGKAFHSEKKPVDMDVQVRSLVSEITIHLPEPYQLIMEKINDLGIIEMDEHQIQTAVINVCLNASEAMEKAHSPSKNILLQLETQTLNSTPFIIFSVLDTGSGITEEELNTAFEPFEGTKKGSEGAGLGLAIAAQIVENHGGKMTLNNRPEGGCIARVMIPKSAIG